MNKLLILSLATLISTTALGADFKPYLGVYGGYNSLSGKDQAEADKSGFNAGAFATASFLTEKLVFDTSLGYQYNRMTGDRTTGSLKTDVTVTTQTVFLDLDLRYRINQNWSFGPTLSNHFNQAGIDNSLSEVEKKNGSRFVNILAGLKVAYDTQIGSQDVRFFASTMTNVNDRERNNMIVNFGVAFALPEFGSKSQPVAQKPVIKKHYKTYDQVADVKVTLKFARVGFATNAYQIDPQGKSRLTKLGKFMATYSHLFERVKISGHTDSRGGKEYNDKLSQDRADSVLKVFAEAGVEEEKMQAVGYGLTRPLDSKETDQAWEKNRRTEIEFFGVTDRDFLNKKLEESLK